MQAPDDSFHTTFLKVMFTSFRLGLPLQKMSFRERKKAVKLSANVAMAAASKDTHWSRALIAHHAKHERDRFLVRSLLGRKRYERLTQRMMVMRRRVRSNYMLPREATGISMVKKRTKVLKRLVPGGEDLDVSSLLGETIDYIGSLQAQVHLMRLLTEALGVSDLSPQGKGAATP